MRLNWTSRSFLATQRSATPIRRAARACHWRGWPGNYIARLRFGEKTFYRYFAAVDEEYLVYRMEGYGTLRLKEHVTGMRNGGFPIDWVIPTDEDRLQPALERGIKKRELIEPFA